jgi:hypothetical protein
MKLWNSQRGIAQGSSLLGCGAVFLGEYFERFLWLLDSEYEYVNTFRNVGEIHMYISLLPLRSLRKKTDILSEFCCLQLQDNENVFAYSL